MSFIINRGYAEVQILKTSETDPISWTILICRCPNSEKRQTEMDIKHFHMYKKIVFKTIGVELF